MRRSSSSMADGVRRKLMVVGKRFLKAMYFWKGFRMLRVVESCILGSFTATWWRFALLTFPISSLSFSFNWKRLML